VLSWSDASTEGELEPKAFSYLFLPNRCAKRCPALECMANGFRFGFRLRLVHRAAPVVWPGKRLIGKWDRRQEGRDECSAMGFPNAISQPGPPGWLEERCVPRSEEGCKSGHRSPRENFCSGPGTNNPCRWYDNGCANAWHAYASASGRKRSVRHPPAATGRDASGWASDNSPATAWDDRPTLPIEHTRKPDSRRPSEAAATAPQPDSGRDKHDHQGQHEQIVARTKWWGADSSMSSKKSCVPFFLPFPTLKELPCH
jgi:hypothetical protein